MNATELLKEVVKQFEDEFEKETDFVNYQQVQNYAIKVAKAISKAVLSKFDKSVINQYNTLDYDICNTVLTGMLKNDYDIVSAACRIAQRIMNADANLHINEILPEFDSDKVHGIIWNLANSDLETFRQNFPVYAENYSQSVVDESARVNADFHFRIGLEPRVVRIADRKCCKWCSNLEGTYRYSDVADKGNDVWKRHENCKCTVTYIPGKGNANGNR